MVATLVSVSIALPARARLQRAIDRRFNRRQFDAVPAVQRYVADPPPGSTVQDALRTAVDDPGLDVAYWIDDRSRWVSEQGHTAVPSDDGIPVRRRDMTIARVAFDPARVERRLVERVVAEAQPELESARLRAAVALQLAVASVLILQSGSASR